MKKTFSIFCALVMLLLLTLPSAALTPVEGLEHCFFNYICNKSVNPVTADGVYHEEEWSDAVELVINKDTMQDFGRWQSSGEPNPAKDFSCTYRFKWDETYFYVLEIRTDTHYCSDFAGQDFNAVSPWMLDGTAIFFCDNEMPDESNRCDIKFYSFVDELQTPAVYIGNSNEQDEAYVGPSGTADTTYGGSVNGTTIVFELKMAWKIMKDQWHLDSEVKEGTIFRFTPIIMNRDTPDDYAQWDGSSYRQMNFHDCMLLPDEGAVNSENPEFWAALTLAGVGGSLENVEKTPAEPADVDTPELPVEEAPAADEEPAKTEDPATEPSAPAETEPAAPAETEPAAPAETEPAANEGGEKPEEAKKSGCGSFIGGGAVVLCAILGCAWIAGKR